MDLLQGTVTGQTRRLRYGCVVPAKAGTPGGEDRGRLSPAGAPAFAGATSGAAGRSALGGGGGARRGGGLFLEPDPERTAAADEQGRVGIDKRRRIRLFQRPPVEAA